MTPSQSTPHPLDDVPLSPATRCDMVLSALMDGESDHQSWDELWAAEDGHGGVHATWHSYHVIGDVLRAGPGALGTADAVATASAMGFARRVTRLACERGPLAAVSQPLATPGPTEGLPARAAANDSVFRWKMVAGLASFTAVLGISWGVTGGALQGDGAGLARAPDTLTPLAVVADGTPVLASTPQGQVWRDARLQELMQTHRQSGGVSALQAPAGFLRTAALDVGQR